MCKRLNRQFKKVLSSQEYNSAEPKEVVFILNKIQTIHEKSGIPIKNNFNFNIIVSRYNLFVRLD